MSGPWGLWGFCLAAERAQGPAQLGAEAGPTIAEPQEAAAIAGEPVHALDRRQRARIAKLAERAKRVAFAGAARGGLELRERLEQRSEAASRSREQRGGHGLTGVAAP